MEPQAKQRKRDAVGNLRVLASELGLETNRRQADLTKEAFLVLHTQVAIQTMTPQHRARADAAMQLYLGQAAAPAALPQVPALPILLPPLPGAASSSQPAAESDADGFRLRSSACLFTWNGRHFASVGVEQLWSDFLAWLRGLAFLSRWTATLERSLRSVDTDRLHLHAYVGSGLFMNIYLLLRDMGAPPTLPTSPCGVLCSTVEPVRRRRRRAAWPARAGGAGAGARAGAVTSPRFYCSWPR